jgi:hypothetical protein
MMIVHQMRNWVYSRAPIVLAVALCASCGVARAQRDQSRPGNAAQPNPVNAPERTEPISGTVLEVQGSVEWARVGVSPLESNGWAPVQVNQQLPSGTQLRTGLRSFVNLQFGETTTIALRSATHASLDQLHRSAATETVRIGLGYGVVRGGSTEGAVRSDVRVESTVATLAKRGTEGWEMSVEPMTGRFRISLAEYGLVEAISKLNSAGRTTRTVRPGEYATDVNLANLWIKQDIFDRNVQFYEAHAVSVTDAEFSAANTRGMGVVAPGGGVTLADSAGRINSEFAIQQAAQNFPDRTLPPTTVVVPQPVRRPDGDFGTPTTFRILVPVAALSVGKTPIKAVEMTGRKR